MLVNLFQAYMLVSDKEFHLWICAKRILYNKGQDYMVLQIMELAKNKFLGLQEDGLWKLQTPEEKKIIALTAEIANLKKKANKNPNAKRGKKGRSLMKKGTRTSGTCKSQTTRKPLCTTRRHTTGACIMERMGNGFYTTLTNVNWLRRKPRKTVMTPPRPTTKEKRRRRQNSRCQRCKASWRKKTISER